MGLLDVLAHNHLVQLFEDKKDHEFAVGLGAPLQIHLHQLFTFSGLHKRDCGATEVQEQLPGHARVGFLDCLSHNSGQRLNLQTLAWLGLEERFYIVLDVLSQGGKF